MSQFDYTHCTSAEDDNLDLEIDETDSADISTDQLFVLLGLRDEKICQTSYDGSYVVGRELNSKSTKYIA